MCMESCGVCLSASAVVTAEVSIIKLSSDKRVLVCVYVYVVYGTYWQIVCVCPSRGQVERKEHSGPTRAALATPIITTALATKHYNV